MTRLSTVLFRAVRIFSRKVRKDDSFADVLYLGFGMNAVHDSELTPVQRPPKPHHEYVDESLVLGALKEILASRPFRGSAQCTSLLRYVVEHTLAGEENLLRERVIGAEVFSRKPDYEPGDDPIVRLRASEVRKRLAQYYQSDGANASTRISIPPGSYRATFENRSESPSSAPGGGNAATNSDAPALTSGSAAERDDDPVVSTHKRNTFGNTWLKVACIVAALCLIAGSLFWWLHPNIFSRSSVKQAAFWAPLVSGHVPIIVCVADQTPEDLSEGDWPKRVSAVIAGTATISHQTSDFDIPFVPYVDSMAMGKLTYWLGSRQEPFVLQRSSKLTVDDFRRGPAIIIGASDNDWSLVLLSKLRFHVAVDPKTTVQWIQDTKDPGNLRWRGSGTLSYTASSVDYAIITKVLQPDTGKWLVAIGGLGNHGTEAAADLITDEPLSQFLPDEVKNSNRNIQIVVRTNVINGHNSVPQIVATHSW